jgi:hypothetical protein
VFDLLTDQSFLNALAALVGPLAFFAAPTEEIEHLLFAPDFAVADIEDVVPDLVAGEIGLAEAA